MATVSTETRDVLANCNDFKENAHSLIVLFHLNLAQSQSMTTIPTQMFGTQMGPQGSTLQYGNFEDGNLKVLRMVLYLAILDSHQFLQWQVMNFWVRNLGKPFASVFSWQQSQKSNLSAKMIFSIFLYIRASRSAKVLEKRVKLERKDFPPAPYVFLREKVLDLQFIENFLEKLKYIFQKLSLQNNMFRNCLYKWNMCKQISNLCFHSFKKLSDIVASFINTGQLQYCVLTFYFLALCLPLYKFKIWN